MKTTVARLTLMAFLAVPALVAAACKGDENGDSKDGKGSKLDIGGNITLTAGDQVELTATMRNDDGTTSIVTTSPQTVWSVANAQIATVSAGVISGVDAGTTTVQATFEGTHSPARAVIVK